jgi:hypothetical protein
MRFVYFQCPHFLERWKNTIPAYEIFFLLVGNIFGSVLLSSLCLRIMLQSYLGKTEDVSLKIATSTIKSENLRC